MLKKTIQISGLLFVLFCLVRVPVMASSFQIIRFTDQEPVTVRIDVDAMHPHAVGLKAVDPNFKQDGLTDFTGIRLKTLFSEWGIPTGDGVTVVGTDQYLGFIPAQDIQKDIALLAWQLNGQPISGLMGGPMKIVYSRGAGIHGSCYIWYVDTIFVGEPNLPFLEFTRGHVTKKVFPEKLKADIQTLDPNIFSIPQGCKKSRETKRYGEEVRAIPLQSIIGKHTDKPVQKITLVPFAGAGIKIGKQILSYPVYIALSRGEKPIHSSLGGPFSVIFPVEQYPELSGMVPDFGALFFLKEIVAE